MNFFFANPLNKRVSSGANKQLSDLFKTWFLESEKFELLPSPFETGVENIATVISFKKVYLDVNICYNLGIDQFSPRLKQTLCFTNTKIFYYKNPKEFYKLDPLNVLENTNLEDQNESHGILHIM